MKNWKDFKKELLKDKEVFKEYKKLEPRYALISQLIEARMKKGLTQKEVALKIGTKQANIARMESGNCNPTLEFLENFSRALGVKLVIQVR